MAEEDVLGGRQVRRQREFLVDDDDALGQGVVGRLHDDGLAVERHRAAIRAVDTAEDLDQRRFPGAVLADDGVHFAGADAEVDIASTVCSEGFAQAPCFKQQRLSSPVRVPVGRPGKRFAGAIRPVTLQGSAGGAKSPQPRPIHSSAFSGTTVGESGSCRYWPGFS